MTSFSAISLLALVLVNDNLVATALFLNFSLNNGPLNIWRADLDVLVYCDHQDLVELHGLPHLNLLQKFVVKYHAFVHAILLSTSERTPRMVTGSRLANTTTLRPMRSSALKSALIPATQVRCSSPISSVS